MHIIAYLSLLAALLCSLAGGGAAILQLWQQSSNHLRFIQKTQWVVAFCILLASALLLHVLFWQDYSFEYVAAYTDSNLPVFYRLTAFWAGQPGSMLFWALAVAICGAIFSLNKVSSRVDDTTALWFWTFFYANMAFFCLILTSWSNPFMIVEPAPLDGNGLNPLLQNPGMIFHPPLLFMGYAAFTPPACLALAQMCSGHTKDWPQVTRPFIMSGWILLTAGIILGAWWAYMELGWGGYWGWDPVENASLLPWLMAAACLHILIIKRHTHKLERATAFLMALTIIASFFATYLTRSGIIQSVHAFGDGGVGTPLLCFVALSLLVSILAVMGRKQGESLTNPISREGALVLTGWIFIALALIILVATLWPVLTRIVGGASQGLDASFYNRVCLPWTVLLLILLSICAWLGWNNTFVSRNSNWKFYIVCAAFIIALVVIWFLGFHKPLPLIAASASFAILCSLIMLSFNKGSWHSKHFISAFGSHLGIALIGIGVAFSGAYTEENELLLSKNQTAEAGPYVVELENIIDGEGQGYDYLKARLRVTQDGKTIAVLDPERRIYAKFGSMQFSEVDVSSSLTKDIYASLLGMDEDFKVMIRLSIEPLVSWIWLGGIIMCVIPIFGIWRLK